MRDVRKACRRVLRLLVVATLAAGCVPAAELRPSQAEAKRGPGPRAALPSAGARLLPGGGASPSAPTDSAARSSAPPGQRWVRGYWHWNGVRYVYVPERLEPIPARGGRGAR